MNGQILNQSDVELRVRYGSVGSIIFLVHRLADVVGAQVFGSESLMMLDINRS